MRQGQTVSHRSDDLWPFRSRITPQASTRQKPMHGKDSTGRLRPLPRTSARWGTHPLTGDDGDRLRAVQDAAVNPLEVVSASGAGHSRHYRRAVAPLNHRSDPVHKGHAFEDSACSPGQLNACSVTGEQRLELERWPLINACCESVSGVQLE